MHHPTGVQIRTFQQFHVDNESLFLILDKPAPFLYASSPEEFLLISASDEQADSRLMNSY